jgi:hypothetical protein
VTLVQVDVVSSEAAQAGVALFHNMFPRKPAIVWPLSHRKIDFRCQNKGVARVILQGTPDHLLGRAPVISVGGIKEVDAKFIGFVYALNSCLFCYRTSVGQPTAKSNSTDAHTCASQPSVLHGLFSLSGDILIYSVYSMARR